METLYKKHGGDKEKPSLTMLYGKKRQQAREEVIREIAKIFDSMKFSTSTKGSISEIIAGLRKHLPIENASKLKNDEKVLNSACRKIAGALNGFFGSGFIDLDLSTENLCREVSDKLYSLTVNVNGEYYDVLANVSYIIKNIDTVLEALDANFNKIKKGISNDAGKNFHQMAINALKKFATELNVMIDAKRDKSFIDELEKNNEIKQYFKNLSDHRYNVSLAKLFDSTFNFATILEKIHKLSKDLGIPIDKIKKITKSANPIQELSEIVGMKFAHLKDEEYEKYAESYKKLRDILREPNIDLVFGKGEEKKLLEENIAALNKKKFKKRERIVIMFFDIINSKFAEINVEVEALLKSKSASFKMPNSALKKLSELFNKIPEIKDYKWYYVMLGIDLGDTNRRMRESDLLVFKHIHAGLQSFTELSKNQHIKNIISRFGEIIDLIENMGEKFRKIEKGDKKGSGFYDTLVGIDTRIKNLADSAADGINSLAKNIKEIAGSGEFNDLEYMSYNDPTKILSKFTKLGVSILANIKKTEIMDNFKSVIDSEIIKDFEKIKAIQISDYKKTIIENFEYKNEIVEKKFCGIFGGRTVNAGGNISFYQLENKKGDVIHRMPHTIAAEAVTRETAEKYYDNFKKYYDAYVESLIGLVETAEALENHYNNVIGDMATSEKFENILFDVNTDIISNASAKNQLLIRSTNDGDIVTNFLVNDAVNDRIRISIKTNSDGEHYYFNNLYANTANLKTQPLSVDEFINGHRTAYKVFGFESLISVFAKVFKKDEFMDTTFKSPTQISESLLKYLALASFCMFNREGCVEAANQGHPDSLIATNNMVRLAGKANNVAAGAYPWCAVIPETILNRQDTNHNFAIKLLKKHQRNIRANNALVTGAINGLFIYDYSGPDRDDWRYVDGAIDVRETECSKIIDNLTNLFTGIIGSMLGKIILTFDTYNMFNTTNLNTFGVRHIYSRMIVGGNPAFKVKVDPNLIEIYIRANLLLKFYKRINNYYAAQNPGANDEKILWSINVEGPYRILYKHLETQELAQMEYVADLVEICNMLYERFKSDPDPCLSIMREISKDFNEKIGYINLVKFAELKKNRVTDPGSINIRDNSLLRVENDGVKKYAPSREYFDKRRINDDIVNIQDKVKFEYSNQIYNNIQEIINRMDTDLGEIYNDRKFNEIGDLVIGPRLEHMKSEIKEASDKLEYLVKYFNSSIPGNNTMEDFADNDAHKQPLEVIYEMLHVAFAVKDTILNPACAPAYFNNHHFDENLYSLFCNKYINLYPNFSYGKYVMKPSQRDILATIDNEMIQFPHDELVKIEKYKGQLKGFFSEIEKITTIFNKHYPEFVEMLRKINAGRLLSNNSKGNTVLYPDNKQLIKALTLTGSVSKTFQGMGEITGSGEGVYISRDSVISPGNCAGYSYVSKNYDLQRDILTSSNIWGGAATARISGLSIMDFVLMTDSNYRLDPKVQYLTILNSFLNAHANNTTTLAGNFRCKDFIPFTRRVAAKFKFTNKPFHVSDETITWFNNYKTYFNIGYGAAAKSLTGSGGVNDLSTNIDVNGYGAIGLNDITLDSVIDFNRSKVSATHTSHAVKDSFNVAGPLVNDAGHVDSNASLSVAYSAHLRSRNYVIANATEPCKGSHPEHSLLKNMFSFAGDIIIPAADAIAGSSFLFDANGANATAGAAAFGVNGNLPVAPNDSLYITLIKKLLESQVGCMLLLVAAVNFKFNGVNLGNSYVPVPDDVMFKSAQDYISYLFSSDSSGESRVRGPNYAADTQRDDANIKMIVMANAISVLNKCQRVQHAGTYSAVSQPINARPVQFSQVVIGQCVQEADIITRDMVQAGMASGANFQLYTALNIQGAAAVHADSDHATTPSLNEVLRNIVGSPQYGGEKDINKIYGYLSANSKRDKVVFNPYNLNMAVNVNNVISGVTNNTNACAQNILEAQLANRPNIGLNQNMFGIPRGIEYVTSQVLSPRIPVYKIELGMASVGTITATSGIVNDPVLKGIVNELASAAPQTATNNPNARIFEDVGSLVIAPDKLTNRVEFPGNDGQNYVRFSGTGMGAYDSLRYDGNGGGGGSWPLTLLQVLLAGADKDVELRRIVVAAFTCMFKSTASLTINPSKQFTVNDIKDHALDIFGPNEPTKTAIKNLFSDWDGDLLFSPRYLYSNIDTIAGGEFIYYPTKSLINDDSMEFITNNKRECLAMYKLASHIGKYRGYDRTQIGAAPNANMAPGDMIHQLNTQLLLQTRNGTASVFNRIFSKSIYDVIGILNNKMLISGVNKIKDIIHHIREAELQLGSVINTALTVGNLPENIIGTAIGRATTQTNDLLAGAAITAVDCDMLLGFSTYTHGVGGNNMHNTTLNTFFPFLARRFRLIKNTANTDIYETTARRLTNAGNLDVAAATGVGLIDSAVEGNRTFRNNILFGAILFGVNCIRCVKADTGGNASTRAALITGIEDAGQNTDLVEGHGYRDTFILTPNAANGADAQGLKLIWWKFAPDPVIQVSIGSGIGTVQGAGEFSNAYWDKVHTLLTEIETDVPATVASSLSNYEIIRNFIIFLKTVTPEFFPGIEDVKKAFYTAMNLDYSSNSGGTTDFVDIYELIYDIFPKSFSQILVSNKLIEIDWSQAKRLWSDLMAIYKSKDPRYIKLLNTLNNLTKHTVLNMDTDCVNINTGNPIPGENLIDKHLEYFDSFKLNDLRRQFSNLCTEFVKKTSDNKTVVNDKMVVTKFRTFYSKIIDPILSNDFIYIVKDSTIPYIDQGLYNVIKSSALKNQKDTKNGDRGAVQENYELLTDVLKLKIKAHIYKFNVDFIDMKNKLEFFKKIIFESDVDDILGKTVDGIQKMINMCLTIISIITDVINEINDQPRAGELMKNYFNAFASLNGGKPIVPFGLMLGYANDIIINKKPSELNYAVRAYFNANSKLANFDYFKNEISVLEKSRFPVMGIKTDDLLTVLRNAYCDYYMRYNNLVIRSNRLYGKFLTNNGAGVNDREVYIQFKSVNGNLLFVDELGLGVNTFQNGVPPGNTRYFIIKTANRDRNNAINYTTVIQENDARYALTKYINSIMENNQGNARTTIQLLYINLIEKNFVPINFRSLYKSLTFSNILLLDSVFKKYAHVKNARHPLTIDFQADPTFYSPDILVLDQGSTDQTPHLLDNNLTQKVLKPLLQNFAMDHSSKAHGFINLIDKAKDYEIGNEIDDMKQNMQNYDTVFNIY